MYYNKNTIVFFNGEWKEPKTATTSLYDQTLHYGNGVFEGIRSYNTVNGAHIFKAKEHYNRLHNSAKKMHIKLNYSVSELIDISYELLKMNKLTNAYIRPLVSLGPNMTLHPVEKVNFFM